jgi:hypothetical protein
MIQSSYSFTGSRAAHASRSRATPKPKKSDPDLLPLTATAAGVGGGGRARLSKAVGRVGAPSTGSSRAGRDVSGAARLAWVCGVEELVVAQREGAEERSCLAGKAAERERDGLVGVGWATARAEALAAAAPERV